MQAAEKGKKVILLEKNLGVGGSSQFAEGLFAVGSEWNRLRSDPLTKEEAFKTLMEKHGYVIDAAKTKDYVEGSAENISWLAGHGIKFEVVRMTPWEAATWHVISDYKGTNHGAGLIKGLKDAADKAGVETKLGTPATELILNKEGAVVGAKAADKKGNTYTISAKAVILATGGFGDDPQKVKNWAHRDPEGWKSSVPIGKTGDGIVMATKAGAAMGNVSFVQHLGTEGKGIKFLGNLYATSWQPSALWVNCDGNRFSNEDVAFSFAQAANAIYAQPHHYGWSIFDDSQVQYMMKKAWTPASAYWYRSVRNCRICRKRLMMQSLLRAMDLRPLIPLLSLPKNSEFRRPTFRKLWNNTTRLVRSVMTVSITKKRLIFVR